MRLIKGIAATLMLAAVTALATHPALAKDERPNIIVILSDDMGFSDLGCYGSEIPTPNLDKMASEGVRFTQFYNCARCCPSRAALLTGNASHQAGVGHMLRQTGYPGYSDKLSTDVVTMAEVLKESGYRTYMTGKWHVARAISPKGPKDAWPMQRGFEKYYGIITGAANYYDPATLCRGNDFITVENDPEYKPEHYYFTDAIGDNTIKFIDEHEKESPDKPFFVYAAFTAAHWPMQAPEDEIAKQKGKYDAGYDAIRKARFEKLKKLGIIGEDIKLTDTVGDWDKVEDKKWEARNMETYAAMVHRLDTNIGKIMEKLEKDGLASNTIVMFMEDNGGCAETIGRDYKTDYPDKLKPMGPNQLQTRIWPPMQTRDGRPVKTGHEVMAGPADVYLSYGEGWANVSNTPFRLYKHWSHEGGISTPLIVHWPAGIPGDMLNKLVREPSHFIDIMATVVDAGKAKYPTEYKGAEIHPMAGKSLLPLVQGKDFDRGKPIFWEHENNRAVRDGKWKIVTKGNGPWELYDMEADRSETNNLADQHPDLVKKMAGQWDEWAKANDVLPLGGWENTTQADLESEEPSTSASTHRLKAGDTLIGGKRPAIHKREIRVVANVEKWGDHGAVVSDGGTQQGFALYSNNGKPAFAISTGGENFKVEADDALPVGEPARIVATLKLDGTLTVKAGKVSGTAHGSGTIASTPVEGVTVGDDLEGPVTNYGSDRKFNGTVKNVVLQFSEENKPLEQAGPAKGKKAGKSKGKRKAKQQ